MKILIVSPLHDPATVISNIATSNLVDWIKEENIERRNNGFSLIQYKALTGLSANRFALYRNRNVDALFYYGHGLKDRLGDFWIYLLPILDKKNIHWFKDKIIYTMACYSGKNLGQVAIKNGVKTYYGQTTPFFGFVPSLKHQYFKDWFELVNMIPISLMKGETSFSALESFESKARDFYSKYLNRSENMNAQLLFSNALNMEIFGDKMATLK